MKPGYDAANLKRWGTFTEADKRALVSCLRREGWPLRRIAALVVEHIREIERLAEPLGKAEA